MLKTMSDTDGSVHYKVIYASTQIKAKLRNLKENVATKENHCKIVGDNQITKLHRFAVVHVARQSPLDHNDIENADDKT